MEVKIKDIFISFCYHLVLSSLQKTQYYEHSNKRFDPVPLIFLIDLGNELSLKVKLK